MYTTVKTSSNVLLTIFVCTVLFLSGTDVESVDSPKGKITAKPSLIGSVPYSDGKYVEGCGCYFTTPGNLHSDEYVFMGKEGDEKENGWINLSGRITEVLKTNPDVKKSVGEKSFVIQSYHSGTAKITIELTEQSAKEDEELVNYLGDLTVSANGHTEKIKIAGYCGC